MKAFVLTKYGDVDQLSYEEIETPRPGPGEVLVRIAATSVNPVDWKLRSGALREYMPLQLPAVLGRDLAGEVVELGEGVASPAVGTRVMALTNRTYAQYAVVSAELVSVVPEGISLEQAAALPLVTLTGAQLVERGVKPKAGQSLLVTGALGGVGRTAAYVAGRHQGQVIAGVRTSQLSEAESLGTLAVVSLEDEQAMSVFKDLDAVADTVGHDVALRSLKHLRLGGVFASVLGVPEEAKSYDIHTEAIVVRPDAARLRQLAEDVARRHFSIPIARVMKLSELREAHRLAQAGGAGGKIVLLCE